MARSQTSRNIQRRVYDALNVMEALRLVQKERNSIVFLGPGSSKKKEKAIKKAKDTAKKLKNRDVKKKNIKQNIKKNMQKKEKKKIGKKQMKAKMN